MRNLILIAFCTIWVFASVTDTRTSWAQNGVKLWSVDRQAADRFGWSVSVSGDLLAASAPLHSEHRGAVYIFDKGSRIWLQRAKIQASDAEIENHFGQSISLDGDRLVVGAHRKNDLRGAAYVFERDEAGQWVQVAKLVASDGAAEDQFGAQVSISGDRVIVGAAHHDSEGSNAGAAYVFERGEAGAWMEVAKLYGSDAAENDRFGSSVAISGDRAVIGAWLKDAQKGAAYIFEAQSGAFWSETAKILPSDWGAPAHWFGASVDIDQSRVIVGAPNDNVDRTGSAYVFEQANNGNWIELARLQAEDLQPQVGFGQSVAVDGDWIVVGTNIDDRSSSPEGSAYVFKKEPGIWRQYSKLQAADNTGYVDQFAWSVSIDGQRAAIGSFLTDQNGSGAAYVYDDVVSTSTQPMSDLTLPRDVELFQNYPNPFNPRTQISYRLESAGPVVLTVHNVMGEAVAVIDEGLKAPGEYHRDYDASGLPAGVYFYTLRSGDYSVTRKMVLMK